MLNVKPPSPLSSAEAELVLRKWSAARHSWQVRFRDGAQIVSIKPQLVFIVETSLLFERRTKVKFQRSKPANATAPQEIPYPAKSEEELWSHSGTLPAEGARTLTLIDPGWVESECRECDGRGQVVCDSCGGAGTVPCPFCHGSGTRQGTRQVPKQVMTPGGYKTVFANGRYTQVFVPGGFSTAMTTQIYQMPCTCHGGRVQCARCHGSRHLGCPSCGGSGKVETSLAIDSHFRLAAEMHIVGSDKLQPNDVATAKGGVSDHQESQQSGTDLVMSIKDVDTAIADSFKHQASAPGERPRVWQATVRAIPIQIVRFKTAHGRDVNCTMIGDDHTVVLQD